MSSAILGQRNPRPGYSAGRAGALLQQGLIYAAVIASFAMVIGVSLGAGRAHSAIFESHSSACGACIQVIILR